MSDEELNRVTPKYMYLPRMRFKLNLTEHQENEDLKREIFDIVIENHVCQYYEDLCRQLNWTLDEDLLDSMKNANRIAWERLESVDAERDFNETTKNVWREKLELACKTGDYDRATEIARTVLENESNSSSIRAEAGFGLFRAAYLKNDIYTMGMAIREISTLMERSCKTGSDWCCRNKLKVYEAIYCLATRNFTRAAILLLDCVSTFESYELLPFKDVIEYTVLAGMISFSRSELNRHFNGNGLLQQTLLIHSPKYRKYFYYFYECHYAEFFKHLALIELGMKVNPLLHLHYRYYVREMRLKAYTQLLQAYRTLTLKRIALEFEVTEDYIEQEISRFIANGKIRCKIDKVSGTIITLNPAGCEQPLCSPDVSCDRGQIYQRTVRQGDTLLNRLKKLGQVIEF